MKQQTRIRTSVLIDKRHLDFIKVSGIKLSKLVRSLLDGVINEVKRNPKRSK